MTTVGIVGSRTFGDGELVRSVLEDLLREAGRDLLVVSGAAEGADRLGIDVARDLGLATHEFPPLDEDGETAHTLRNGRIVAASDLIVAFFSPGPRSPGTSDTLRQAAARGIPVRVFHEGRWSDR